MHNWALATGHRGANIQHLWKIPLWWIRSITYRLTSPLPSWTRIKILRKWRDSIRSSVSPLWETRIHRNSESKKSMCMIFWLRCRWFLQVASILQGRVSERSLPFLSVALPVRSMISQSRAWMTGLRIFSRSSVVSWIWDSWWIRSITYRLTSPLPSWTRIKILRKWRDSIRSSVSPLWETRIHRNSESKKSMCMIFWLRCRWFLQVASILQGRVSERSLPFLSVALPVRSMISQSRAWMTGLRIFSRSSVVSWIWDLSREATTNVTSKFWNNT